MHEQLSVKKTMCLILGQILHSFISHLCHMIRKLKNFLKLMMSEQKYLLIHHCSFVSSAIALLGSISRVCTLRVSNCICIPGHCLAGGLGSSLRGAEEDCMSWNRCFSQLTPSPFQQQHGTMVQAETLNSHQPPAISLTITGGIILDIKCLLMS